MISTIEKESVIKSKLNMEIRTKKPYALSINMGGDDVSVVAIVYKKM